MDNVLLYTNFVMSQIAEPVGHFCITLQRYRERKERKKKHKVES